jgi:radical SAM protein with 4Fe4S-binding SPASM domain
MFLPDHLKFSESCGTGPYVPDGLLLQWHITERCNLRCEHCYQDVYSGEELTFTQQLEVLEQFKSLLKLWRSKTGNNNLRGHITITGGEPFVRSDFLDLLQVFAQNKSFFSFAILTNGSFIDSKMAAKLAALKPSFVQVSLEGTKNTHDSIRGSGNFEQTVSAINHLVREKIHTLISFTAHRGNFREFPELVQIGKKLNVDRIWSDRFIPRGAGNDMAQEMLTQEETQEFFKIMEEERTKIKRSWFNKTEIAMHRALQFLVGDGKPYRCTAGDTLITVQPNGDLYPCRRMPISVGNLTNTPLEELYYKNELFKDLRDKNKVSEGCEGCFYNKLCQGGLKCLSYAVTGDPFKKDPGCWNNSDANPSLEAENLTELKYETQ